jgi:hypothetical protein
VEENFSPCASKEQFQASSPVEYSSAITTIVIDGSLSSLDANPSNPSGDPVGDPMIVTRAMTPAKHLAC